MITLSRATTTYALLLSLEGRLLRYRGISGAFPGGGLAGALSSFDWHASATSLMQAALLTSLFLLVVAMSGSSGIGELADARRALGL